MAATVERDEHGGDGDDRREGGRASPWAGGRRLVHDRIALLRLLDAVPVSARVGLTTAMLAANLLPAATALAVAWLVGRVIDASADGGSMSGVTAPLALVAVLLTADQVAQSLLVPYRDWTAARVNGAMRRTVRQAVSARPGVEHLESQAVRDAAALPIENAYLFNLGAGAEGQLWLMTRFVGAIAAAGVVASASWPAAVATFGLIAWQRSLLRRHYAAAIASGMVDTTADGRAATYWSEVLSGSAGAQEVRLFGFRPFALDRFHRHGSRPVEELSRVLLGAHRLHLTIFTLNALAAGIPFVLLAREAIDGRLDAVGLTAALGGVVAVGRVLMAMGWEAFSIEASVPQLAAVAQLDRFHAEERERRRDRPPATQSDAVPTIAFEGVTFAYPGHEEPVLRGLDLVLRPGESVAIVGENGAGKTTLLKLLAGFSTPTEGRILVDGVDLRDLDPWAWRRRLAVIFQDFTRFELSALENVSLADPARPDARAVAAVAAGAAGAATLVEGLPSGWDTVLSRAYSGGVDLSGGQWQRIALARALYSAGVGGQVLILDEPTASLDVGAEVALFDQLLTHAAGCTAIVVSHRYSTVRRADRIVVIDEGHVVEDGSHLDLVAAGGRYARLYDLQARRFRDGPDDAGLPAPDPAATEAARAEKATSALPAPDPAATEAPRAEKATAEQPPLARPPDPPAGEDGSSTGAGS